MSFQTVTMTLLDGFLLNIELFAVTLVLSLPLDWWCPSAP